MTRSQLARARIPLHACTLLGLGLCACTATDYGPADFGDAGTGAASGGLVVHTQVVNLPALVTTATLTFGTLEAQSDREPSDVPRVPMSTPLPFQIDAPVSITNATPATYGGVRIVALDALTLTTTSGNTLIADFGNVAPIAVRCAGPGSYLTVGGTLQLDLVLDLSGVQTVLTSNGAYPITLPLVTITDPTLLGALYDTLSQDLTAICPP